MPKECSPPRTAIHSKGRDMKGGWYPCPGCGKCSPGYNTGGSPQVLSVKVLRNTKKKQKKTCIWRFELSITQKCWNQSVLGTEVLNLESAADLIINFSFKLRAIRFGAHFELIFFLFFLIKFFKKKSMPRNLLSGAKLLATTIS